jgi:hypothetical protein
MNTNFDNLLDSALAKDKSRLPEQPLLPDASLQAKLASTPPSAPGNGGISAGIGGFPLAKLGMIALGLAGIGAAVYFYFQDPQAPSPAQITTSPKANEVLQKPMTPQEEKPADMLLKKRSLTDSLKPVEKKDSLTQQQGTTIEDNLLHPTTPPNRYSRDTTDVHFHAK